MGPHSYQYRTLSFEHGLLLKDFGYQAISASSVYMPFSLSCLLLQSKHPKVLAVDFPIPREWEFHEGEKVTIITSPQLGKGVVQTVEEQHLIITLASGDVSVSWNEVRKHYIIGNFVQVCHGLCKGRSGWVVDVSDEEIQCTEKHPREPGPKDLAVATTIDVSIILCTTPRIYMFTI